jgi:hypothetical protein
MDLWSGRITPYPHPGSCEADVRRAPQVEHAVQHDNDDDYLNRLPSVGCERSPPPVTPKSDSSPCMDVQP